MHMPCTPVAAHPLPPTRSTHRAPLRPLTPFIPLPQIVMPAELMSEPSNPNLYNDFSRIATDLNVYTGVDYAEIMEHLNEFWKIGEVPIYLNSR